MSRSSRLACKLLLSTRSGRSEFHRLRQLYGFVHLYADVSGGALKLRVPQDELPSAEVSGDRSGLRAPEKLIVLPPAPSRSTIVPIFYSKLRDIFDQALESSSNECADAEAI
jgi:hypothetical protein